MTGGVGGGLATEAQSSTPDSHRPEVPPLPAPASRGARAGHRASFTSLSVLDVHCTCCLGSVWITQHNFGSLQPTTYRLLKLNSNHHTTSNVTYSPKSSLPPIKLFLTHWLYLVFFIIYIKMMILSFHCHCCPRFKQIVSPEVVELRYIVMWIVKLQFIRFFPEVGASYKSLKEIN